ncbi:hypothetical protein J1G33_20235 [Pseudomonas sp. P867]|uniref:hypothetical protein n=1 Tax=Pseudomonas sp. P867 TaxID=2816050 RepID=UPI001CA721EE|nr:hypothetical protein [Pseudomonas sp. P867]MBY8972728.1 hypothetical protein [Pseudomonas sp. P867]
MQGEFLGFLESDPFKNVSRPKGGHLFRVYSIMNRCPMEFFYRTQLIEWGWLEFDSSLLSFIPVNKVFKTTDGALFVAFKLVYLNSEVLVYVAELGVEKVEQAFEQCCAAIGMSSRHIGTGVSGDKRFEVWNRFKILAFISRWRDDITAKNVKEFILALRNCSSCALSSFESIEGFSDGRGFAFALEMVRIGRFNIPSMHDRLINRKAVVVCSPKGKE